MSGGQIWTQTGGSTVIDIVNLDTAAEIAIATADAIDSTYFEALATGSAVSIQSINSGVDKNVTITKTVGAAITVAGMSDGTDPDVSVYEYIASHLSSIDTSGPVTPISLPSISNVPNGYILIYKDATGTATVNEITINPDGDDTIDGEDTLVIDTAYGCAWLCANTTTANWEIV